MDFVELTTTLDASFTREIVSINVNTVGLSYPNTENLEVTINETTCTPNRLCLVDKDSVIYLYVNTINSKYHKLAINSIESISIGD